MQVRHAPAEPQTNLGFPPGQQSLFVEQDDPEPPQQVPLLPQSRLLQQSEFWPQLVPRLSHAPHFPEDRQTSPLQHSFADEQLPFEPTHGFVHVPSVQLSPAQQSESAPQVFPVTPQASHLPFERQARPAQHWVESVQAEPVPVQHLFVSSQVSPGQHCGVAVLLHSSLNLEQQRSS